MVGNLKGRCNRESKIAVLLAGDAGIYSWHNIVLILIDISTPEPPKLDFNFLA
jgi:hypothetical protein